MRAVRYGVFALSGTANIKVAPGMMDRLHYSLSLHLLEEPALSEAAIDSAVCYFALEVLGRDSARFEKVLDLFGAGFGAESDFIAKCKLKSNFFKSNVVSGFLFSFSLVLPGKGVEDEDANSEVSVADCL